MSSSVREQFFEPRGLARLAAGDILVFQRVGFAIEQRPVFEETLDQLARMSRLVGTLWLFGIFVDRSI